MIVLVGFLDNEEIIQQIDKKQKEEMLKRREELKNKMYLSEIIKKEKPKFSESNLILAPVGSGKSHLIENYLIPKDYNKKILYLTSNSALKDSICPNDNEERKALAEKGKSIRFFTTQNRNKYGDRKYSVHVMTYAEFGERVSSPTQTFTKDIGLIFCDEIHSLPIYYSYSNATSLRLALYWLLTPKENVQTFYFTATKDSIDKFEKKHPGHFNLIEVFDYLNHPKIRKYIARSTYYISHLDQLRPHLKARYEYFKYKNAKALAFTSKKEEQRKIASIATSEGYTPLVLWSVNNEEPMSEEQLRAREIMLKTGLIPEPYNILIINGAMQEGWNLFDEDVELAILDTTDKTEQIQSLGRIRKDIELVIKKDKSKEQLNTVELDEMYLNKELSSADKQALCDDLYILDSRGRVKKWPSIKEILENSGYIINDTYSIIDGKRTRVSIIEIAK